MSKVRAWQNLTDEWGTPVGAPEWLAGVQVMWSDRLRKYLYRVTCADGVKRVAHPGDWIILAPDGNLLVVPDADHAAVIAALEAHAPRSPHPAASRPPSPQGGEERAPPPAHVEPRGAAATSARGSTAEGGRPNGEGEDR